MSFLEIILLALAMGIDCCVVSFSQGLIFKHQRIKNSLCLALTMGGFQGIMPCIGYISAEIIHKYVLPVADFIVFLIFLSLGLKFITEAFNPKEEQICCIDFKCLIGMGFATSIDALAAGGSLNFSHTALDIPAITIGFMSFFMSLIGFWSGNLVKHFPSKYLEITGGAILILLAFSIWK